MGDNIDPRQVARERAQAALTDEQYAHWRAVGRAGERLRSRNPIDEPRPWPWVASTTEVWAATGDDIDRQIQVGLEHGGCLIRCMHAVGDRRCRLDAGHLGRHDPCS
jgi:hypothetical protein